MYQFLCTFFFQTALCVEVWREVGKARLGIGDVDVGWLGSYPNLGFSIHWFTGQQGATDA